jgi:hypothetical protein
VSKEGGEFVGIITATGLPDPKIAKIPGILLLSKIRVNPRNLCHSLHHRCYLRLKINQNCSYLNAKNG